MYSLHNSSCCFLTGLLLSRLDKGSGLTLLQAKDWLHVRTGRAHSAAGAAENSHMLHRTLGGLKG